jgi:xanthine dehydrogenase YagT iron-sulfur-binding subunit
MNDRSDDGNVDITTLPPAEASITQAIHGAEQRLDVLPWTTLPDLLREQLDLTGTKKSCDHGQGSACTGLLDDKRVELCLILAIM